MRKLLAEADGGRLLGELETKGNITLPLPDGPVTLDSDDIQVRLQAKEGWAAAQGHAVVVVLATELTPELIREGLARELVRTIQDRRKEMGCQFTDRIVVGVVTESAELQSGDRAISGLHPRRDAGGRVVTWRSARTLSQWRSKWRVIALTLYVKVVARLIEHEPCAQSLDQEPFRIAVLISGGGTTLRNFIEKIAAGQLPVEIALVVSSSPTARGLQFARDAGIPSVVIERKSFANQDDFSRAIFDHCRRARADLVVMAGFLKRVTIPADFANRVVNIHPALVPAFCGEGFYGHRVHEAVLEYGAKLSGCTVHFADNQYDHGPVIVQRAVPVLDDDTPETLAARVFEAECEAYPEALRLIAAGRVSVEGRRVRIKPE